VENPEQLNLLTQFGCNNYQGYLFSRPVPADDIATLLQQQQRQLQA
jgi:EAL domain-containing protein (putative c-di-GMP-specific phosphodiesterase class I)